MKLTVAETGMEIETETPQDKAYLREVFGCYPRETLTFKIVERSPGGIVCILWCDSAT